MEVNTTASASPAGGEAYPKPEVAILFFGLALILGALCKQVFARTPVPYTVALLIIGIILGTIGGCPRFPLSFILHLYWKLPWTIKCS